MITSIVLSTVRGRLKESCDDLGKDDRKQHDRQLCEHLEGADLGQSPYRQTAESLALFFFDGLGLLAVIFVHSESP